MVMSIHDIFCLIWDAALHLPERTCILIFRKDREKG